MKPATEVTGRKLKVGDVVRRATTTPGYTSLTGKPRELGDMDGTIVQFFPDGGSGAGKPQGSAKVLWASGSTASHDAHMLVKVGEVLTWSRKRNEHQDVVWGAGRYEIVVTAETAAAKPCGWGVKIDGQTALGKPSMRMAALRKSYDARGDPLFFSSVAGAKAFCCRHHLGLVNP